MSAWKIIVMIACASALASAQDFPREHSLYRWSLVALASANVFDAATSWNRVEANPILASRNGGFDGRSIAIKSGITAGLIASQAWVHSWSLHHGHPRVARSLTWLNFGSSAAIMGVGWHNLRVRQ